MFLVSFFPSSSSFSFYFFLVPCPLLFPLLQSLFFSLFMLCSLCLCLFYVSSDVFSCSCFFVFSFFFGESSSSADFCFSSDWSCSASFFSRLPCYFLLSCASFVSSSSVFFLFFFVLVFFLFFFCSSVLRSKRRRERFSWLLWCVFGFLSFLDRPSRMDLRRKNGKSCTLFFGTFLSKKTFYPLCLGFSFCRFASQTRLFALRFRTCKMKVHARNATKIGISGHQPGGPVKRPWVFTVLGFRVDALLRQNMHIGVLGLFLSNPA